MTIKPQNSEEPRSDETREDSRDQILNTQARQRELRRRLHQIYLRAVQRQRRIRAKIRLLQAFMKNGPPQYNRRKKGGK